MDERPPFQVETWLQSVYEMSCSDVGIDEVYDKIGDILDDLDMKHFDDAMEAHGGPRLFPHCKGEKPNFELVDEILSKAEPEKMTTSVALAFLVMTFKDKTNYQNYRDYIEKARKRFRREHDNKTANELCKPYE